MLILINARVRGSCKNSLQKIKQNYLTLSWQHRFIWQILAVTPDSATSLYGQHGQVNVDFTYEEKIRVISLVASG